MRFQLPTSVETPPFCRSVEPVACQTPPPANETTAVKVAPPWLMRVMVLSQVPSTGAPNPDPLWALAGWLTLLIQRTDAASTSAPTLRFMPVLLPKDAILICFLSSSEVPAYSGYCPV